MIFPRLRNLVTASLVLVLLGVSVEPATPAPSEQPAVFKAAGFKRTLDGRYIRCEEGARTLSYTPGAIEFADLNSDGQPEAWVTETSSFCYGNPHTYFALLRKNGRVWRQLLSDIGIPVVQKTRRRGWPDIEVGGPGFGKFPVYRWNGRAYVRVEPPR
jgi:hypothetical protein